MNVYSVTILTERNENFVRAMLKPLSEFARVFIEGSDTTDVSEDQGTVTIDRHNLSAFEVETRNEVRD